MTGPISRLLKFSGDKSGASAVEFGLLAVPFLGIILAVFETALVFFTNEALEVAVQDAARNIMTGQAQSAGISTASSFVSTYLCPASGQKFLPSYVDCSSLIVDVRPATSFSAADLARTFYKSSATQEFCPGGPGTIVVVRVAYPMPVFLPLLGQITATTIGTITAGLVNDVPNNAGWKHLLVGTASFQTEPFSSTSYTAPSGC